VDLERAVLLHALVGLDLSVKSYAGGSPLRDRAHAALLARLRARLHPRLRGPVVFMQAVHIGVRSMQAVHRSDPPGVPEGQDMQDLHTGQPEIEPRSMNVDYSR